MVELQSYTDVTKKSQTEKIVNVFRNEYYDLEVSILGDVLRITI
jgi:hypothetical protein